MDIILLQVAGHFGRGALNIGTIVIDDTLTPFHDQAIDEAALTHVKVGGNVVRIQMEGCRAWLPLSHSYLTYNTLQGHRFLQMNNIGPIHGLLYYFPVYLGVCESVSPDYGFKDGELEMLQWKIRLRS